MWEFDTPVNGRPGTEGGMASETGLKGATAAVAGLWVTRKSGKRIGEGGSFPEWRSVEKLGKFGILFICRGGGEYMLIDSPLWSRLFLFDLSLLLFSLRWSSHTGEKERGNTDGRCELPKR